MSDPEHAPFVDRPRSSENTLADVWRQVGDVQQEFAELPWFGQHRFDGRIADLRGVLDDALADPTHQDEREEGRAFRNYHEMEFLRHSLSAVVYAPQLRYAPEDDIPFLRDMLALSVQYGATQALIRVTLDPISESSEEHRKRSSGFSNEMVPLAILNRPAIVRNYNEIAVPGSKHEDERQAIDLKILEIHGARPMVPIQVKTRLGSDDHIPKGVLAIEASDFGNQKLRTQQTIRVEQLEGGSPETRRDLNNQATLLRHHIGRLLSRAQAEELAARATLQQTFQTRRRATRSVKPPTMSFRVGDTTPALGNLLEQLLNEQTEQAS